MTPARTAILDPVGTRRPDRGSTAPAPTDLTPRRRRGQRVAWLMLPLAGLAIVVLAWEFASRGGLVSPSSLPPLSDALAQLLGLLGEEGFRSALLLTLRAWGLGLVIAASIALPVGMLLGLNGRAYRFVRLPLEAIRPVPPIVILPLALLALGGGLTFQATLIVQGALWPLLITVTYGIRETDPVALDTARSFRLGGWRTLVFVRIPSAAPLMASGLKLAAASAFAVTIVTELLGGARGMGTRLMIAQSGGDVVTVYAVTIMAGIVGLAIATAFGLLERRFLGWKVGSS